MKGTRASHPPPQATVSPPAPQVVWYVDGKLFAVADHPYTARWKIQPGNHVFQIGLPYAPLRSERVSVRVVDRGRRAA